MQTGRAAKPRRRHCEHHHAILLGTAPWMFSPLWRLESALGSMPIVNRRDSLELSLVSALLEADTPSMAQGFSMAVWQYSLLNPVVNQCAMRS
jgi:hypothetical protein